MRHEFVDVFHVRIIALKLFHKTFYVTFLKIELAGILLYLFLVMYPWVPVK